jgi:hypothetical protein
MDIADLLITLLAIPIVACTAFIFGRNPYRWALYAYFIKFWCLIPLFMLSKRETPPFPKWIHQPASANIKNLCGFNDGIKGICT